MTDFTQTQPIQLTDAELINIRTLGQTAEAAITAAGDGPPPVGVWKAMYQYIFGLISPTSSGYALQAPSAQQYWFEQAPFITGDQENVPSGYFVRDVTAIGFNVASPSDPTVQAVSNAIGAAIFASINDTGKLPAFWQQLNDDIYSALYGGTTPYPYPQLPIAGWGGTFYYLNAPYNPSGSINETSAPSASVGQYVLGNATANQTFITNYSQAIANTVSHFQSATPQTGQLISSFLSGLNGIANLYKSGWQGKLDIVELVAKSLIDYAALGGSTAVLQSALISFVQSQVGLDFGSGSTSITGCGGANVLVGGQGIGSAGNDTLTGGGALDTFLVNLPTTGSVTQTINDTTGLGQIVVANNGQFDTLGGSAADLLTAVAGQQDTWQDAGGTQYVYGPSNDELVISGGYLGSGNEIIVDNFNVGMATGINPISGAAGGFAGIFLPGSLSLNATANAGTGGSTPNFVEGTDQSYTLSLSAPSATVQTITVSLSGAIPSDFEVSVGDTIEQLNSNGTFSVSLAAGETNVSFGLIDVTDDNGSSDIAKGARLQLAASIQNPDTLVGGTIQTASLNFNYIPAGVNTDALQSPSDTITGVDAGGTPDTWDYFGDNNNDYIATTNQNNVVQAYGGNNSIVGNSNSNQIDLGSGNNIIVGNYGTDTILVGNGANEIYAGSKTSLQNAIALGESAAATGVQGDLIAVEDGNNTIVGGNGNDIILAGAGENVVVMGPGSDTFWGGNNVTEASPDWAFIGGVLSGVSVYEEGYTNSFAQPYNGLGYQNVYLPTATIASSASDTIFGGKGNDAIDLGNGNNYVDMGSGNSSVHGGMGNNTIIAGSGTDYITGGGGTEYIYGGSGADSIYGGDGSNTIIGGSGNSTIYASYGPGGATQFLNASLDQNYVTGGSGNDLVYGSAGQDTLIAGTGNSTIYGLSGNENILGGSGNDLLVGGTGNDAIAAGGSGVDSLYAHGGVSSNSVLTGGDGQDYISGGGGTNILIAGDGGTAGAATSVFASQGTVASNTTIYGGLGVDLLQGGTGSTVIYAGDGGTGAAPTTILGWTSGNDTLYGGLGTDSIQGGGGTNVLYAGDGGTAAAPTSVNGGIGISTLNGGAGNSVLFDTYSGDDLLVSTTGNDTLIGVGADTLVAGSGNDVLQANSGSVNFDINAGFGNDTVFTSGTDNLSFGTDDIAPTDFSGSVGIDAHGNTYLGLSGDGGFLSIENALTGAIGSVNFADGGSVSMLTLLTDAFGSDQTVSGGSNEIIVNIVSNESVSAGNNNDTVSSWGNSDTIQGGSAGYGDKIYSAGTDASIVSGTGYDSITAAGANASVTGSASGGDNIAVTGANAAITSKSKYDSITVSGTNDTVNAVSGHSSFYVNNATAVIQITGGIAEDTIYASVSYTAPTSIQILELAGSANITATGNAAADTLMGGSGSDTLVAGSGAATMIGGAGNTTFVVNSSSDVVQDSATTANNTVEAALSYTLGTDVNTLMLTGTAALTGTANSGNDTLISNTGIDTLVGGIGNDTFVLNNASDVVQDSLGTATIIYAASTPNFTLPSGVNALTLTGTAALYATGNSGNDQMSANTGADTLVAGSGTDTLVSSATGTAIDSLVGGTGNDLFVVNYSSDIVTVGATHGVDTIDSSVSYSAAANVANLALTGTANISAIGNSLSNVLTANSGSDTLTAGTGIATLIGGAGNDLFAVNSASDIVQNSSAAASDTITSSVNYSLPSNINTLQLTGSAALAGWANSGEDTLISNAGVDTLFGGAGNDTFVVNAAGDVVVDSSGTSTNAIISSVHYTLPTDVNALTLSGTAALLAAGNAANDLITANTGADTLVAGSGVDTLVSSSSGSAIESLVGGTGNDLFLVNYGADIVSVGTSLGVDTIQASVSYTLPTNVNILTLAGTSNLSATAVSGNNTLVGNAGNNILRAGSGYDLLSAGSGIDTLIGGTGSDIFVINNVSDVLESISGASGNEVNSSVSYSMAAGISKLVLFGTAGVVGTGNSVADIMQANYGNDTLIAGSGLATMVEGEGADLFVVNNSGDTVSSIGPKSGIDTIESSVSYSLPNSVAVLTLTGTANITGTGNALLDTITGNAGADVLNAGTADDTLIAGTGVATLVGGIASLSDTFVINNTADVVTDAVSINNNVLISSVTYVLPTNINTLVLTGSGNVKGTSNSANDSITGNAGADTLVAGSGNDTLSAGSGLVTLQGGSGSDVFVVNNTADVIQGASASGQNAVFSSATYVLPTNVNVLTLTGIANISGTGNAASDTLTAGAGADTLIAGAGTDTLIGSTGNDTFVINSTGDVVQDATTASSNTLQSSASYSLISNVNSLIFTGTAALEGSANAGNDTLTSNTGADTLVGGAGNDTFVITNAGVVVQDTYISTNNTVQSSVSYSLIADVNTLVLTGTASLKGTGNGGNDLLVSNSGVDTLVGGSGSDTFVIGNTADVILDTVATASNVIISSVNYTLPTDINVLTLSGTGALSATGNAASDIITANSGNDTLIAGGGPTTLIGGAGNDTFVVNSSSDVVQDSFVNSMNVLQSSVNYSLAASVSDLVLTGTAGLTGVANNGNDTLVSNSGMDTLVGGSGSDLFIINNSADVILNATSSDTIESSVNYTLPSSVNTLIQIGSANITATGNGNSDSITAGSGNDTLVDGSGSGGVTLIGGAGNDTFVINNANDVLVDSSTTSVNTIQSSVSYTLPTNVDTLILTGTASLTATGNGDTTNVLTANVGNDLLVGTASSTTINGGGGNDTIDAGPQSNVIYAGNGGTTSQPTVVYGNATGTNISTQSTIYGGSGTDILYGGPGSDLIYGGSGADTLVSLGVDTLVGGSGTAFLDGSGAAGPTEFAFNAGFGQETINTAALSGDSLYFGAGIEPGSLSLSMSAGAPSLEITSGTGSIVATYGLQPGIITNVTFADTGSETLTQLMQVDGPGMQTVTGYGGTALVTSNSQGFNDDGSIGSIYDFGNSDSISANSSEASIYDYGNNDSISAFDPVLDVLGNSDVVTINSGVGHPVTIGGSNDVLYVYGGGGAVIEQSSDVVYFDSSGGGVSADVNYALPTNAQDLTLNAGFNGLTGTSNAVGGYLTADADYDTLVGGAGDDTLKAVGNYDVLVGGSGAEQYILQTSTDAIQYGSGNASLNSVQTSFSYTLNGGANTLYVGASNAIAQGNSGNDLITAAGTGDSLIAGNGNDTLVADGLQDTLVAGSGNDTFEMENNNSSTSDVIVNPSGTSSNTVVLNVATGSNVLDYTLPTNINTLVINQGNFVATANNGNDSLVAGSYDTLVAGSGLDTLGDQSTSAGANTFVAGSNNDTFIAGMESDTYDFNSGFKNDVITGTPTGATIDFGTGILQSGLTFTPVAGSLGSAPALVIAGYGGSVTVAGGILPNAINSIHFGDGSSTTVAALLAPTGQSTVTGSGGNFIFNSNASASIVGGTGQDTIIAWGSSDSLDAGSGGSAIYAGGNSDQLTGGIGNDYLDAIGDYDTITGGSGHDTLIASNDSSGYTDLVSGTGVDSLVGGPGGANNFYVNNASDVVIAQAGSINTLYSTVNVVAPANVAEVMLEASGITVTGIAGVVLVADGGDTLIAGSGAETLSALAETGTSANTFVTGSGQETLDMVGGDTADINSGFGSIQVYGDVYSGRPTTFLMDFGTGISGSSLTATAVIDSNGANALELSSASGVMTLDGGLAGVNYEFAFGSSGILTLGQFLAQVNVTTSTIVGGSGNLILNGTASTAITGGSGNDTIYAAGANDTITGGSGHQVLDALGANDSVVGGSASDTLTGLGTNDTLVAGTAVDTLIGGTGASVAIVINSTSDVVQLQSSPGADTLYASVNYSLPTNLNALVLTGTTALKGSANNGADTLTSNTALDTLVGGSGNDLFIVSNSSDVIQDTSTTASNTAQSSVSFSLAAHVNNLILTGTGALIGTGNATADTLTSNSGVDTLIGGTGNDVFILNNSSDVVQDTTTSTSNTVQASFSYVLPTNVNSLILTGTFALTGTANTGADTLSSNTGLDTLVGSSGNDTFVINNSSDVIQDTSTTATNSAQSSVSYSLATNVNTLTLTGTAALIGTANTGADTLTSNTGLDTLVGGSGSDTFVINSSSDVIQDTFTTTTNTARSTVSYSLATNVNTLTLTGSTNIVGTANSGSDSLTGNSGTDTLQGGAGADTLIAGTGIDTLLGGAGNTTFVINSASDVVQDTSTISSNTLRSTVTYVLSTNVNTLVFTGTSALKGTANAGNDTLTSNTGVDTLVGGAGNDTFVVSNAGDVVQDTVATATNVVQSSVIFTLPTDVNALVLTGTTALHGTGNAGNDSLVANTGADTLSAGNGTDTLVSSASGTAVDSLVGGTDTDLFVVNYAGDIVTVGSTHGADTIESSVSYTNAVNVANLILTGTGNLSGTGTTTADQLTANSGTDTLTAGTGTATIVGGAGNDTFVVNSTSDVVQDSYTTTTNVISSSVSYTLATNVNRLLLTGTSALVGTANTGNDTLTANTGADTLVSGTGAAVDSLVGGTGANLFIVNNASDIVTVGSAHGVDTIQSSVNYTASANVANLTLTGTSALAGTGNSLAGTITANTGNDTLTAGTAADTLVGSSGTDTFVVNSASDIVSVATSGTSDTIQSSATTYTLPTNVQYLMLTGTSALSGTGNTATSLIVGNTSNDTLTGGTGIAALEGGTSAGSDQIKASSNQAALIAGGGSSTLTGGAYKDFYAAGKVSDTITTGATANVVSVNKGDGATTLAPTTSATNVLSLGAGIDTESLFFTKTGNNLILTDGVTGDSINFTNWYVGSADQTTKTLQVVEIASANYNSGGGDGLRNKALEAFNFTSLVAAYNTAGSPANWALSTDMASAQLTSSSTADYGGDLAYYFGLNGNLTGVDLSAVQSTLTNASYGTATQTIDAFSSISGGGGLHLLVTKPGEATPPIVEPTVAATQPPIAEPTTTQAAISAHAQSAGEASTSADLTNVRPGPHLPELRSAIEPQQISPLLITPRWGIQDPRRSDALGTFTAVTASDAAKVVKGLEARPLTKQSGETSIDVPISQQFVDPINVAWLRMHGALDEISEGRFGGAESSAEHDDIATDALLGSVTPDRVRRTIGDVGLESPLARRRTM
jgi:trimeric autotransporter adhesin